MKSWIMTKVNNMKLMTQVLTLIGLMIVGFIISGYIGAKALGKVQVNGEAYNAIMNNKDLVADILPPPAYLIEAWQVALEMLASKGENLQPLIKKSNQLAVDFTERTKYWDTAISNTEMHDIMMNQLKPAGDAFLDIRDSSISPHYNQGIQKELTSLYKP